MHTPSFHWFFWHTHPRLILSPLFAANLLFSALSLSLSAVLFLTFLSLVSLFLKSASFACTHSHTHTRFSLSFLSLSLTHPHTHVLKANERVLLAEFPAAAVCVLHGPGPGLGVRQHLSDDRQPPADVQVR